MKETKRYNMPLLRITVDKDLKEFVNIIQKIDYIESVSQVYRIKNGIVITTDFGLKIITNSDVKSKKYMIVKKLYELEKSKINKKGKIEYIDLRFEDYIIKRTKGDQK
jgi:cell division protein FtsQ